MRRQAGQDHSGYGDAEYAQGQLCEAVGVVKPGHAAGRQERGQHSIQQQIELADGYAEQGRHHQLQYAPDALVAGIPDRPRHQVEAVQGRQLE